MHNNTFYADQEKYLNKLKNFIAQNEKKKQ